MYERDTDRAKEAMQEIMKKGPLKTLVIIGAVAVFLLFLRPWVQVGAGERGIVMNFGAVQKVVLAEGLHFRIPVMQEIVLMDVKVQKALTDADASSADL
ncbi:MAG TPA: SPFH domain-containing protein, partial [Syntrophales bacterium]|nr:SPFH domain-containing protein [Syntrophales bacterium]